MARPKRYFLLMRSSANTSRALEELLIEVEAKESEGCELVSIVSETNYISSVTNSVTTYYQAVMRKPAE